MIKIGSIIVAMRESKGLTQKQLGELIGVGQVTISRWETDRHLPTIEQFVSLADALECSLDELAGLSKAKPKLR